MPLTNYLRDNLTGHLALGDAYTAPATIYLALFTTAPDEDGGGTEVTGGSYVRKASTWEATGTPGLAQLAAQVTWSSLPAATVTHMALMDASTAGNMLGWAELSSPVTVASGDPFAFGAGDTTFSLI